MLLCSRKQSHHVDPHPCSPLFFSFTGVQHTFTGKKHAYFLSFHFRRSTTKNAEPRKRNSYLIQFSFNIREATRFCLFFCYFMFTMCAVVAGDFSSLAASKHLIKKAFLDSLIVFSLHFLLSFLSLCRAFFVCLIISTYFH